VEERSIYRRSATPLPQEGGAHTVPNFAGSLLFTHTPRDAELPDFDVAAHENGSATPRANGSGSQRSPILGIPSIYAYTLCRSTIKFDVVSQVGERRVSWGQPHLQSYPRSAEFQGCSLTGVFLYLCLHHLTQNDQIQHGNTYGEGRRVFKRSATQLHLHKYVAWSVSDS